MSNVAAIVVTYNSSDQISACLAALARSTLPLDVVVVDNGSRDDTVARVKRDHAGVHVVEQENLGFAAGNNRGVAYLDGSGRRYVFMVNPDVYVDSTCAEALVAAMDANPRAAIASPKLYFADGRTVFFAGGSFDWPNGATVIRGTGKPDEGLETEVTRMDFVCGAAMLVRVEAILNVGPMPEEYFLYFEETDWGCRFAAAGYEMLYVPAATGRHELSSSTGRESPLYWYYMTRNNLLFMSRFGSGHRATFRSALRRSRLRAVRHWIRHPSRDNLSRMWAVSKAYMDFARGRFGKGW